MSLLCCNYKCNCTVAALIAGAALGVIAAFLQITGLITVTVVYLAVALGIATVYLPVLLLASALDGHADQSKCSCSALTVTLAGILGTIALAILLLAVGITATSVISAILVGILVFFFVLMLTGTACLIRAITDCHQS